MTTPGLKTLTHHLHLGCAVALTLFVGCGDDGKSDGDTQATETAAETAETSASGSGNEAGSEGVDGDGDADAGDGDGDTGDGDADAGDGDGDTGDGDGDTGDGDGDTGDGDGDGDGDTGDGDGDPIICAELLDQEACDAEDACQTVNGQPLVEGLGSQCLDPAEFLGCIDASVCGQAQTWFCIGEDDELYLVPNTCGPEGADMCAGPMVPPGPCLP
jgi:hypothetical protein